jgi:hypothetical protein
VPPRSTREREAERRRQKLEHVEEQIRSGSLTVRQMTPEERARLLKPSVERRGSR